MGFNISDFKSTVAHKSKYTKYMINAKSISLEYINQLKKLS